MNILKFGVRYGTYHWDITAYFHNDADLTMDYHRESGPVRKYFSETHKLSILKDQNLKSIAHRDLSKWCGVNGA